MVLTRSIETMGALEGEAWSLKLAIMTRLYSQSGGKVHVRTHILAREPDVEQGMSAQDT